MNPFLPLFVAIPLAGAFLIMIFGRFIKDLNKYLTSLIMLAAVVISFYTLFNASGNTSVYKVGGWEPVNKIPVAIYMVLDSFNAIILCIINLIGFLSAFYSISYIKRYTSENYFYALFCLMVAGMNGVVLSGDLFNLYVFLEISVISSYALVAFGVGKHELEASFKYQILGGLASFVILFGIGLIYWKTKTLNIADVKEVFKSGSDIPFYRFVEIFILTGFGLKAALIPFHAWLPDAHSSAPSPISAMLSGVLIKAVGIYVIIRLFFNMFIISEEIAVLITTLGAVSMVAGAFLAFRQWDLKRLLAYSSISQIGYVVIAFGMGMIIMARGGNQALAALSVAGGIYHLINHAVFKGLLFLNAGALEYTSGTRDLREMDIWSSQMPVTSSTSFIASMSISGMPPFNGFFSKLIIIIAAINGRFYLLAFLAILVSIVTLAYFLKYQRYAFKSKSVINKNDNVKTEVPFTMKFSMIILGILCLALSLLAMPAIREALLAPATNIILNAANYSSVITELNIL
jgi:multicomponent Na+:H+ antiporter subunit D